MLPINHIAQQQYFKTQQVTAFEKQLPTKDEKISQLSTLIFSINTVHGGFITCDKMLQLKELGVTDQQLQDIENQRSRLLGGMKQSSSASSKSTDEDQFDITGMGEPIKIVSIPSNKIQIGKQLGKGSFGTVYEGTWEYRKVAVKCYEGTTLPAKIAREIQHEVSIMQRLDHESLVRFFGVMEDDKHPAMLVMEHGANGSLYSYLHGDTQISWKHRLHLAEELARGLAYLHDKNIVHRDIKSLNIVLDKNFNAKWCDFGLAQLKMHSSTTSKSEASSGVVGTTRWMAPELFSRGTSTRSTQSDIWALGLVFFELASREVPYKDAYSNDEVKDWIKDGEKEKVPEECNEEAPDFGALMQRCWANRGGRPTAVQIAGELSLLVEGPKAEKWLSSTKASSNKKETPKEVNSSYSHFSVTPIPVPKIVQHPVKAAVLAPVQPAKAPVLAPAQKVKASGSVRVPEIAFGKSQWERYFGDIGIEPPLPSNIEEFLNSPCPLPEEYVKKPQGLLSVFTKLVKTEKKALKWENTSGKKIKDTHMLVLIPARINGKPLTLTSLAELVKAPKGGGQATKYWYISDSVTEEHGSHSIDQSYWVLMSKDVIGGSRDKSYEGQQGLVTELARRTGKSYEVPKLLEASICLFMRYVSTGELLFDWETYTRCHEKYGNYQLVVGGFSPAGLNVNDYNHGDYERHGVASFLSLGSS